MKSNKKSQKATTNDVLKNSSHNDLDLCVILVEISC